MSVSNFLFPMKLSVVLPVYNEKENLRRLDDELFSVLRSLVENKLISDYEVILIDDGSTDSSAELIETLIKKYPFCLAEHHSKNLGLGRALFTGIQKASGDLIITLDADFTFHPQQIPVLLKEYILDNQIDCIIGSAAIGELKYVAWWRKFLSRSANWLYRIVSGKNFTAATSIFRLYRSKAIKEIKWKSTGFSANAEILLQLIKQNKNIREVPVLLTGRLYGYSKINILKEIFNHLALILKILLNRF